MSEQRFSEQEVHSILREAVRFTPTSPTEGITVDQLRQFAAEAGIAPEALDQSIRNHQSRRNAKLLSYLRKTTLTLDWEISRSDIDNIAAICNALPPYFYRTAGSYDVIRLDRFGFFSVISILRRDGFTHISIDRQYQLEFVVGTLTLLAGSFGFFGLVIENEAKLGGKILPVFLVTALISTLTWAYGNWSNAKKRSKFANELVHELNAHLVD